MKNWVNAVSMKLLCGKPDYNYIATGDKLPSEKVQYSIKYILMLQVLFEASFKLCEPKQVAEDF